MQIFGMRFLFLSLFLGLSPSVSFGALTLTLESVGSADLQNLTVGQPLTINVLLSGLESPTELGYLAGTAIFESHLLGTATNVVPGSIVPVEAGFIGSAIAPGVADGNYDFLFAGDVPITTNGAFFSFKVSVQQAGSGTIAFELTSLAANASDGSELMLTAGNSLSFSAPETATAVPEPASWITCCAGILALAAAGRKHRAQRKHYSR